MVKFFILVSMCLAGALAQDMPSVVNDIYGPPHAPVYVVYSTIPNNYGPYSVPYTIPYTQSYSASYPVSYSPSYVAPSYVAPVYSPEVISNPSSSAEVLSIGASKTVINKPYVPVY